VDHLDQKLNAIVGAAVRALVESGADDERIGAFAAAHRMRVAEILGMSPTPAGPPDLIEVVREAVRGVLTESGLAARPVRQTAKRVFVMVAGKRTSVTVDPRLFQKVSEVNGGDAKAQAVIRVQSVRVDRRAADRHHATPIPTGPRKQASLAGWVNSRPRPGASPACR
jgi:hypothetical protein